MPPESTIQLYHPTDPSTAPNVVKTKYDAVRTILLQLIPNDAEGVPFSDVADRVAQTLPANTLRSCDSLGWYTAAIKLDLEARGVIERVPNSCPQRVRRTQPT